MSGHSKWSTIKRKKAATDAKRGQAFTRLARLLTIAAKEGGSDPEMNVRLRLAIDVARKENMPNANIERAIQKGSGEGDGDVLESATYEIYGPEKVAFLVEAVTDNRNRTLTELRLVLQKHGGRLGEGGSVAWMFSRKGYVLFSANDRTDEIEMELIEVGAESIDEQGDRLRVIFPPGQLSGIQDVLSRASVEVQEANIQMMPKDSIPVSQNGQVKIVALTEALDDLDDVVSVVTNASNE